MKRTPRNYDGQKPTGKKLQEILPQFLSGLSEKCREAPHQVLEAWPEIVGERARQLTRAVSFEAGVLTVQVKNSTLLSLLAMHEKPRLMAAFRKRFPNLSIREIFFRIG